MCPTCLTRIDITEGQRFTHAHVLPRAAGGGLATVLCKPCNDRFGRDQDKWLGEYVRVVQGKRTVYDAQPGYFEINGVRVAGDYQFTADRGLALRVFVWNGKASPETLKALDDLPKKSSHTLTLTLPLFENDHLVSVGCLTAAYLLWFRELGYSWALQEHLEPVRQQICRPSEHVISRQVTARSKQVFQRPWIGFGRLAGELVLLAGLADRLVFLPPVGRGNFYAALPSDYKGASLDQTRVLRFGGRHGFDYPVAIAFEDRMIVAPDVVLNGAAQDDARLIVLPPGGGQPQIILLERRPSSTA